MGGVFYGPGKIIATVIATPTPPATQATLTLVPCSINPVVIVAENPNRKVLMIYNEAIYTLFIKFGDGFNVSSDNFTIAVTAGAIYEMPSNTYVGVIEGIWTQLDNVGKAHVTELT